MHSLVLGLTLSRILVAPFIFISAIFLENYWLPFWLFNFAALTDYFDGKLARDFNVESKLGSILDPIGDKLLLVFAVITVIIFTKDIYVALMSAFILAREFWVSALREYSSSFDITNATKVTLVAKTKTTFQFIALSMFFLGAAADLALITFLASFVLLIAVLLAYKSAIDYTKKTLVNRKFTI
jgi:CDP-diacylglycerol--glycerol-3-phosphate 3-phosphatidyltransferase